MSSLLETSHPASAHSPAQVNYGTSIGRTDMTSVDSALAATRTLDRKWTRSTEMIIAHGRPQHLSDGFDDEEEEEEQVATTEVEHETPYGVRKMTAITNTLSRKNLVYLYATCATLPRFSKCPLTPPQGAHHLGRRLGRIAMHEWRRALLSLPLLRSRFHLHNRRRHQCAIMRLARICGD